MNFGAVKLAGSISCTVYIYCVATGLTPNSKMAGILPLSLGLPIVRVGLRCYDFMAVLLHG